INTYQDILESQYPLDDAVAALVIANLGQLYFERNRYESATRFLQRSLDKLPTDRVKSRAAIRKNLAEAYAKIGSYQKAKTLYEQSLSEARSQMQFYNRRIGKTYISMGQTLFEAQQQYDQALDYYQKALQEVIPGFTSTQIHDNPSEEMLRTENTILEALQAKADVLHKRYLETGGSPDNLETALDCYRKLHKVEQLLRQNYSSREAEYQILDASHRRVEKALDIVFTMYKQSREKRHIYNAFQFIERSKDILLKESLNEIEAINASLIPDSLRQQRKQLDRQIHRRNIQMYQLELQAKQNPQWAAQKDSLQGEVDVLENQKYHLLNQLRNQHSDYYHFRYQSNLASVDAIQQQVLGETKGGFIAYFVGERSTYVILITEREADFIQLDFSNGLKNMVTDFVRNVSNQGSMKEYRRLAYELYERIFAPIAQSIELPRRLIIVPDGILSFLPFDALLTHPKAPANAKDYPFLLRKHRVSIGFSGSLLLHQPTRQQTASQSYLGIAPIEFAQRKLNNLLASEQEIQTAHNFFGGTLQQGAQASKAAYLREVANYKIVHLATHASADSNSAYPWISFYDSLLYLPEIYTTQLNSDLVILSGCETSRGAFKRGEGILSIARGYAFANCPSMLSTIWKVDDHATSQLVAAYCQGIFGGKDKDIAIHEAKMGYLDTCKIDKTYPYYWAGIVQTGAIHPLYPAQNNTNFVYYLLAALAIFIGWQIVKNRKTVPYETE
ncbi:MAG: CHAT domain-containing tetratricopeptide repeat protein, partial [Bacteroidota bacterium]